MSTQTTTPPRRGVLGAHFLHFKESLEQYYEPTLRGFIDDKYGPATSYLCPLCLNALLLTANGNLYLTQQFTEDHYPPESAGGQQTVLVCDSCNNSAGHDYEYELKEELIARSYNKEIPNAELKVKAKIAGVDTNQLKILFSRAEDGAHVFNLGNNILNPKVAAWTEATKNNAVPFEITVTVESTNQKFVAKSLLKAAYLYCFCLWGYEFCYSETGEKIRQVLADKLEYPLRHGHFFWAEDNLEVFPQGVCYISKPSNLVSFIVNIPMILEETGYKCIVGVPIPNPTSTGWQNLEALAVKAENFKEEVTFHKIPHYNIPQMLKGYSEIWKMISAGEQVIVPR